MPATRKRATLACLATVLYATVILPAGCRPRPPRTPLQDRDPIFVIPAIHESAQATRYRDVPRLIELLDSDDAAIRLHSIQALRDLTGQRFGYQFWDPPAARRPSIDRWKQWAVDTGILPPEAAPASRPTTGAATGR